MASVSMNGPAAAAMAAAAAAATVAEMAKDRLQKPGIPSQNDYDNDCSSETINEQKFTSFSPLSETDLSLPKSEMASCSTTPDESSRDQARRDISDRISTHGAVPDLSGFRQPTRNSPVRVKHSRGNWAIEVPFPYSLPIAAGYLLYSAFSSFSSDTKSESNNADRSTPPASSAATTIPKAITSTPSDNGTDSESDTGNARQQRQSSRYRKLESKEMERILENDGEDIYEKLSTKANAEFGPGSSRTIWENKDFRFDVGHLDRKKGIRHWEFQVNRDPESQAAKRLLKDSKKGTHRKLMKGTFNVRTPPGFEEWKKAVLERLE